MHFEPLSRKNLADFHSVLAQELTSVLRADFDSRVLQDDHLAAVLYLNTTPVGIICAVLEDNALYIKYLVVSTFFRRNGLGKKLVLYALQRRSMDLAARVYLNVWIKNEQAKLFYKTLGFQMSKEIPHYYSKLFPSTSWELETTYGELLRLIEGRQEASTTGGGRW